MSIVEQLISRHWEITIWLREGASQAIVDAWRAELAEIQRELKRIAEQEALPF